MYLFIPHIFTEDPFCEKQCSGEWGWKGGGGMQSLVRHRNNYVPVADLGGLPVYLLEDTYL